MAAPLFFVPGHNGIGDYLEMTAAWIASLAMTRKLNRQRPEFGHDALAGVAAIAAYVMLGNGLEGFDMSLKDR